MIARLGRCVKYFCVMHCEKYTKLAHNAQALTLCGPAGTHTICSEGSNSHDTGWFVIQAKEVPQLVDEDTVELGTLQVGTQDYEL